MNIQVDPTRSNLASAMLNSKIRPRAVVGCGVEIFSTVLRITSPDHLVGGGVAALRAIMVEEVDFFCLPTEQLKSTQELVQHVSVHSG